MSLEIRIYRKNIENPVIINDESIGKGNLKNFSTDIADMFKYTEMAMMVNNNESIILRPSQIDLIHIINNNQESEEDIITDGE